LTLLEASGTPQLWIVIITAIGGLAGLSGWILVPTCTLALVIAAWRRFNSICAGAVDHHGERHWLLELAELLSNQALAATLAFLAGRLAGS
jgi:hypothetical protein